MSEMYIDTAKIQPVYSAPLKIASYDVGPDVCLRLSALLRYQQEAAEGHFSPGGLGWDGMAARGMAFVCTRWHGEILRAPRLGETVVLETWHRQRKGPRFLRCHRWITPAGEELIRGVTEFALVSTEGHRLLRGEEFDAFGIPEQVERTVACADPGRLALPPLSPIGEYRVRPSDADMNGHMNNTHYADLCEDALPAGKRPTEAWIRFVHEAKVGDRIALEGAVVEEALFLRGTGDGGSVFEAKLCLEGTAGGA